MIGSKNIIIFLVSGLLVILGFLSFRPISNLSMDDCTSINGAVSRIEADKENFDISIHLKNDNHRYYINRGMEKGISPDKLQEKISGREITIHFDNKWRPINLFLDIPRHIIRISHKGEILYNEIK